MLHCDLLTGFQSTMENSFLTYFTMQGFLWRVLFPEYKLEIAVIFLVLFNFQLNEI